jgi:hypothetical protein
MVVFTEKCRAARRSRPLGFLLVVLSPDRSCESAVSLLLSILDFALSEVERDRLYWNVATGLAAGLIPGYEQIGERPFEKVSLLLAGLARGQNAFANVFAIRASQKKLRTGFIREHCEMKILHLDLPCAATSTVGEAPLLALSKGPGFELDFARVAFSLALSFNPLDLQKIINSHFAFSFLELILIDYFRTD